MSPDGSPAMPLPGPGLCPGLPGSCRLPGFSKPKLFCLFFSFTGFLCYVHVSRSAFFFCKYFIVFFQQEMDNVAEKMNLFRYGLKSQVGPSIGRLKIPHTGGVLKKLNKCQYR